MADITITITIPDAKSNKIKQGFERMRPIPVDDKGAAKYTSKRWIAECCAEYVERIAKAGLQEIARDAVSDDVTVTRG
jgi:hypothetical protein